MARQSLRLRNGGEPKSIAEIRTLRTINIRLRHDVSEAKTVAARHELLRREADHRIKNSLQIVASVLALQARREVGLDTRDALHAAAARVHAVARMHEALQLDGREEIVDLGTLIKAMAASLHAMAGEPSAIEIIVDAESVPTPIRVAQPVALIVNELVINALRHAFPNGRSGAITIVVGQSDGRLAIRVADDGIGLPEGHGGDHHGFGMTLVRAMLGEIGASLSTESVNGACFKISAPLGAVAEASAQLQKRCAATRIVNQGLVLNP